MFNKRINPIRDIPTGLSDEEYEAIARKIIEAHPVEEIIVERFVCVDYWIPGPMDHIFQQMKDYIIVPVGAILSNPKTENNSTNSDLLKSEDNDKVNSFDYFKMATKPKRCYNSDTIRMHIAHYMNYFEKYYDNDKTLIMVYAYFKFMMDIGFENHIYDEEAFLYDLKKEIIYDPIMTMKINSMTEDNYSLDLNYENSRNPVLKYDNIHAKMLLRLSIFMNMIIPLATHYCSVNKSANIKDLLLKIYDIILNKFLREADMYNKLYETAHTNTKQSSIVHKALWDMQDIRGTNVTIHSLTSVESILLQIVPKYTFNQNIIPYNYKAIQENIGYQVTRIKYEYEYIPFSSSIRDEDENSEFDKFESHHIRQDEAIYVQTKLCCEGAMDTIMYKYGTPSNEEIDFYIRELSANDHQIINSFQMNLIFQFFAKYFGDITATKLINIKDYVIMMITMRNILLDNELPYMAAIISSRIEKLVDKNTVNKKELSKLEKSNYYNLIKDKYKNATKAINVIESSIATIISSDFRAIDFKNRDCNGAEITIPSDKVIEEFLMVIDMIDNI